LSDPLRPTASERTNRETEHIESSTPLVIEAEKPSTVSSRLPTGTQHAVGGGEWRRGVSRTAVVLDPQPLWRDAVEQILNRIHIDVIAKASNADEALDAIVQHGPDLLVTEIDDETQGSQLVDSIRKAREGRPSLKVVVLSGEGTRHTVEQAFAAGAAAYVVKTSHPEDLSAAVRQAFEHSIYFPGATPAGAPSQGDYPAGLTARELEILQLVAKGQSNRQIGELLWVTEQTVKFHLSNIYRKLGVSNRTEASRWAEARNLLLPTSDTARTAEE
jgi:DNA-binding NarL/FixJ family response regulator